MVQVFLSYKREERDRVRAIVSALEAKGHKVWWDPQLDPKDVSYQRQIKREIDGARTCIVAWSRLSVESDFVVAEAEMARAQKKLVCVLLDHDCTPPPPFNTMQLIDLSGWHGDAGHPQWRRALEAVGRPASLVRGDFENAETPQKPKRTASEVVGLAFRNFARISLATGIFGVVCLLALSAWVAWDESRMLRRYEQRVQQAIEQPHPVVSSKRPHYEWGVVEFDGYSTPAVLNNSTAIIVCPSGKAAASSFLGRMENQKESGCFEASSSFPTAWNIYASSSEDSYFARNMLHTFANLMGRRLTVGEAFPKPWTSGGWSPELEQLMMQRDWATRVGNPASQLSEREKELGKLYRYDDGSYAVISKDFRPHLGIAKPDFAAKREDIAEFECEVGLRTIGYASTADLFGSGFGERLPRQAVQSAGSRRERLWVDFRRGVWATAIEGGDLPTDVDADGAVWEDIAAGGDQFVCMRYMWDGSGHTETKSALPLTFTCMDYLDLAKMERAYLSYGELRASHINRHGIHPIVPPEIYLYSRDLVPGTATAGAGSCRELKKRK